MSIILTDQNVVSLHPALIMEVATRHDARTIIVPAGEASKSLATLAYVWEKMTEYGATRHTTLYCIGGGMITDLGGFAAACFKRGIPHVNIATTLLAAVDAAVGGKTGIDFMGLKNELGAFKMPEDTTAYIPAFHTLPPLEILSGWAEAVKTAYIDSAEMTGRILALNPLDITDEDMEEVVDFCRQTKTRVVTEDPTEKGLRKILNFGHTAGHALETMMMLRDTPMPHGVAVAHGILIALILSYDILGLPQSHVTQYAAWLKEYYPRIPFSCKDYDEICRIASHDKKNATAHGEYNFVLLQDIGKPQYDVKVSAAQLRNALDLYQTLI